MQKQKYEFITTDGMIVVIEAETYTEACKIYNAKWRG